MIFVNEITEILEKIKGGKTYTLACSMYEEYIWCDKSGQFYKGMENGMSYSKRKITEEKARKDIFHALSNSKSFDAYFEF